MSPSARPSLQALRARPRSAGEASFFFYDAHFTSDAVKLLPGEYYVGDHDLVLTTTLGSCVAVCLWDHARRVGGMNHIMLPEGAPGDGEAAGRYGSYAMELLINALLRCGAQRDRLQAKVFGGGAVLAAMHSLNVGERNARFALDYLGTERIPVRAQDLLDRHPRKVAFWPASGKAMVRKLPNAHTSELAARERDAASRGADAGGSIDLF